MTGADAVPAATSETRRFLLQPSRHLRIGNAVLHAGCVLLLLAQGWLHSERPIFVISAVFGVLLLLVNAWWRHRPLRVGAGVTTELFHDAGGWQFASAATAAEPVQLLAGTTVTPLALVLNWRDSAGKRHWQLVTADQLGQDDYRRLCRLLWQAGKAAAPSTEPV